MYYKIPIYSFDGFSLFDLFNKLHEFQFKCFIDYNENQFKPSYYRAFWCMPKEFKRIKSERNRFWQHQLIVNDGLCINIEIDDNKVVVNRIAPF